MVAPALNPILAQIFRTRLVQTESGEDRPLHSEISIEEGQFLQDTIRRYKPKRSLEVGCAYGISSLFICEALKQLGAESHIIIDPFQLKSDPSGPDPGYEGLGLLNLKRAGLDDIVRFYPQLSYHCLPELERQGTRVDFAFIDGMHTFDYALVDFFFIDKMLTVGGVVVFDDLHLQSIRKLTRFVLRNLPYRSLHETHMEPTLKRRFFNRVAKSYRVSNLVRNERLVPDLYLGIPSDRFIAIQKTADDTIGDGPTFFRRWDSHHRF
jgi:predicted O-methyltransferase YrrM